MKTEISRNISAADGKAAYDAACKNVLSNKIILGWILKECVSEYKGCTAEEIAEKYIEGAPEIGREAVHRGGEKIVGLNSEDVTIDEGEVAYDILFSAQIPGSEESLSLIINIEAQKKFDPGYPLIKRALYYCSRLISSQYQRYFKKSQYDKLRKVYSIWICPYPPKNRQDTVTSYGISEKNLVGELKEEKANYDILTAMMICLGDGAGENHKGILELLEVLLSSDRTTAEKKNVLESRFGIAMTEEMEGEVTEMCNLSDVLEERAMEKGRAEGMEKGMEKGRAEGIEKGRAEGIMLGVTNNIKQLMENLKMTAEQAMNALGIPKQEQAEYMKLIGQK